MKLTCKVWSRAVLGSIGGGLNKLLQAFVIDVCGCPLRNLVPWQIVSELHTRWLMTPVEVLAVSVWSVGKLYSGSTAISSLAFCGSLCKKQRSRNSNRIVEAIMQLGLCNQRKTRSVECCQVVIVGPSSILIGGADAREERACNMVKQLVI
jgi:hypothetical protein